MKNFQLFNLFLRLDIINQVQFLSYNVLMKSRVWVIILLTSLLFSGQITFAAIPETTLQIAREAEIRAAFENPKSEIVRVGIGDNSFNKYDYDSVVIFSTSEMTVLDGEEYITNVPAYKSVNIKLSSDMFVLTYDNGEVIDQVKGPVRFLCPNGRLGVKNLKRVGSQALYRGEIEITKYNKKLGRFHIVNVIEVEDYLKGVVPNEMPVHFGLEALKAQSVAARNYVLSPRVKAYDAFDVVDSVASQVYFGAGSEKDLGTRAVEETEGVVALYNWDLILAQYSSTAGGYTESFANVFSDPKTKDFPSVSKPYLVAKPDILSQKPLNIEEDAAIFYKSKPDSYDMKSPYYRWERTWTKDELQKVLQNNLPSQSATGFVHPAFSKNNKLDDIAKIEVKKRGESGKIIELEIVTKTQTYKIYKELVIRRLLTNNGKALPSANVVFEHEYDEDGNLLSVKAFGGGYGHGVGLSQYGAGFMATELKMPYDKILKHYYTGITLATKPIILSPANGKKVVAQSFYTKNKHAELIIDNKYQLSHFLVNINGKEKDIELSKNFFKRAERVDISKFIKNGRNTITFYYPEDEDSNKGLRLFVELVGKDDDLF